MIRREFEGVFLFSPRLSSYYSALIMEKQAVIFAYPLNFAKNKCETIGKNIKSIEISIFLIIN